MPFPDPFYRWRPHPWHGLDVGPNPPQIVNSYIEITPFDLVKYEIDKATGYLRVDRLQRTSSQPPTLYGFIPRTYCGHRVHALSPRSDRGDVDPLDICVITERPINRGEVILRARVIGGLQAIDAGEADDKIIAVLENDLFWQNAQDVSDLPNVLVARLRHYFSTYQMEPGGESQMWIAAVYGREQALQVVRAAMADYDEMYGA
ncbi:MAG: inorganic pyrophosphatase [Anaerolineae bacterium]|nr:inorganic pyrophosphatase [Anaerolineae bacterium]